MRRSYPLKYVSFLMILTAFVRFFFGLGMLNIFTTAKYYGADQSTVTLSVVAFGLIVLCSAGELVSGFLGALNWEEPLRSGLCLCWGLVTLALGLAGNACQRATGYGVSLVAWTTGVILPGLYTLAALWFYLGTRELRRSYRR